MPHPEPTVAMTFPTLDEAESALDWIGLEFSETAGAFEGELDDDAAERLDVAYADDETPQGVRALAAVLREQWRDPAMGPAWRVTFEAD